MSKNIWLDWVCVIFSTCHSQILTYHGFWLPTLTSNFGYSKMQYYSIWLLRKLRMFQKLNNGSIKKHLHEQHLETQNCSIQIREFFGIWSKIQSQSSETCSFFLLDIFFHNRLWLWAFDQKEVLFLQLIFNDWCSNQIFDTSFLVPFNGFRSCRDIKRILKCQSCIPSHLSKRNNFKDLYSNVRTREI